MPREKELIPPLEEEQGLAFEPEQELAYHDLVYGSSFGSPFDYATPEKAEAFQEETQKATDISPEDQLRWRGMWPAAIARERGFDWAEVKRIFASDGSSGANLFIKEKLIYGWEPLDGKPELSTWKDNDGLLHIEAWTFNLAFAKALAMGLEPDTGQEFRWVKSWMSEKQRQEDTHNVFEVRYNKSQREIDYQAAVEYGYNADGKSDIYQFVREYGTFKHYKNSEREKIAEAAGQYEVEYETNKSSDDKAIDRENAVINQLSQKLTGFEEQFMLYKTYKDDESLARGAFDPDLMMVTSMKASSSLSKLESSLSEKEFIGGVEAFEKLIKSYEEQYAALAARVAKGYLNKFEQVLLQSQVRYGNKKVIEELHQKLAPFRSHYVEFEKHQAINNRKAAKDNNNWMDYSAPSSEQADKAYRQAEVSKNKAIDDIKKIAEDHPVFTEENIPLDYRIDKVKLANADPDQLQELILEYIEDRLSDVRESREELAGDHELIFGMAQLIDMTNDSRGISKGSIFDLIIASKIKEIEDKEMAVNLLLAVLAVALAIVSGGTGTPASVALLTGSGALGIGTYFTIDEIIKYERNEDFAGAGLAEDPSLLWVVVSIAGLALDAAAVVKVLRSVAPAAKTFNETADISRFRKELDKLKRSKEIDEKLANSIENAAHTKKSADEAYRAFREAAAQAHLGKFFDPQVLVPLVKNVFFRIKQHGYTIEKFFLEYAQARNLANVSELTHEEVKLLNRAYTEGKEAVKRYRTEEEFLKFVDEVDSLSKNAEDLPTKVSGDYELKELKQAHDFGDLHGGGSLNFKDSEAGIEGVFIEAGSGEKIPVSFKYIQGDNIKEVFRTLRENGASIKNAPTKSPNGEAAQFCRFGSDANTHIYMNIKSFSKDEILTYYRNLPEGRHHLALGTNQAVFEEIRIIGNDGEALIFRNYQLVE